MIILVFMLPARRGNGVNQLSYVYSKQNALQRRVPRAESNDKKLPLLASFAWIQCEFDQLVWTNKNKGKI